MEEVRAYKDFDEFFSEAQGKPAIQLKVYGKVYNLPTEIPATLMLETYRMYKTGLTNVPEAKQMEMAIAMLGEENVAEWCEKGMSVSQLTEIMKWAGTQMNAEKSSGKK